LADLLVYSKVQAPTKEIDMSRRAVMRILAAGPLLSATIAWAALDQSKKAADAYSSDVASTWFDTLYDIVKTERTAPPPASRIYGIAGVALYESVVPGALENRSMVGQLNGLDSLPSCRVGKKYHWPTVANSALATVIRGLYSSASQPSIDRINVQEQSFSSQFQLVLPGPDYARSATFGKELGDAVLAWAATDGLVTFKNCAYVPAPVQGAWEPTPPAFNPNPLEPCWGEIRPMVLKSGAECAPIGNPIFSTDPASGFLAAALDVYNTGVNLTSEQKAIADYWADGAGATGTPPGHWIAIVGQISRNSHLSLMSSAEAFARVGIAVHDAFIECWHTKYAYNLQRPVTYIRDQIDPTWSSYITTPAFPSYHSGHSTQSGAASTVLTDQFGIMSITDTTHTDHGLVPPMAPRTFDSFAEAADEAAISRLYGGIHYAFDNNDGLTSGRCIGSLMRERVQFKN
jgi:hypothetical protein